MTTFPVAPPPRKARKEYPNDPDVDDLLAQLLSSVGPISSNSSGSKSDTSRANRGNYRGGPPFAPQRPFVMNGRSSKEKPYRSYPQGDDDVARWQFWPKRMWMGSLVGPEFTRVST